MYNRILLKLSGDALKGETSYGIDPQTVQGMPLSRKKPKY